MHSEIKVTRPTGGIVPYVNVVGASDAVAFYEKAFGAEVLDRLPAEDGQRLMHCHMRINGGSVFVSDCFPEHGMEHQPSHSFTIHLVVNDVELWWKRAVDAGAQVTLPLQVMFWGDRYGIVRDPFGVQWSMGAPAKPAA